MKVLHITNTLSEGGVESFLLQLLPGMRGEGYVVEILVLDKSKIVLKSAFEERGIKVWVGKGKNVYSPFNILYIKKMLPFYDFVHVHLWPVQLWVSLARRLSGTKARFITTEHNNFNKRRRYRLYRPVEQWMYSRYEVIVGVCDTSRDNLLRWIRHPNVVSIPNGIQCDLFARAQAYSKAELGVSTGDFVVTMTARFFEQKDHLTLIRSLGMLPDCVHLLLVGSGTTESLCREEADRLMLSERVHFLGHRSDIACILKSSDVCVLSTHYEGLPISVIEYMAAGRAVVGTDVDGVRELINNPLLLARPQDPEDLAFKIKRLIDDPQFCLQIASHNFKEAQKYNIESMVADYLSIYKDCVE